MDKDKKGGEFESKYFKILKWNAVTIWTWADIYDHCSICKNPMAEMCIECQANQDTLETKCMKVSGRCNHAFHQHCIDNWVQRHNNCPLDNLEWVAMKIFE